MYAIDIETHDPNLHSLGDGSIRKDGFVLCIGVYGDGEEGHIEDVFEPDDPKVAAILRTKDSKVFHNGVYDTTWLVNGCGFELNGKIEDTMTREALLNEYEDSYSLDQCCRRRGIEGKNYEDTVQNWWTSYGGKGKAIVHLKEIPLSIVGKYCLQDVKATHQLWHAQEPLITQRELQKVNDIEARLYPLLIKMKRIGVRIDEHKREDLAFDWMNKAADLQQALLEQWGLENINSPKQVAAFFNAQGVHSPKKTPSGAESWGSDVLASLAHPAAELLGDAKIYSKALGTFIKGYFTDCIVNGRIHPTFKPTLRDQGGTITGRFSSDSPNMQNIPADDRTLGPDIRSLVLPEEDHILCAFDYKQIEYAVFIHYAIGQGAEAARQAIRDGTDYHSLTMKLLKWDVEEHQKAFGWSPHDARKMVKNKNFTCITPDSFIATRRGYVRAKTLREDDKLVMGTGGWRAFVGEKPQYRFTLSNGQQFCVTTDHPFQHKEAANIQIGDEFPIVECTTWAEKNHIFQSAQQRHGWNGQIEVDEDIAYVLGVWLGDGSVHWKHSDHSVMQAISFCTPPENTQYLKTVLKPLHATTTRVGANWEVWSIASKALATWVVEHCGRMKTKHVPDFIYSSPRSVAVAFMTGLLDSDGTVHNNQPQILNTNEELMRGVARLAAMLGWPAYWASEQYDSMGCQGTLYRLRFYKCDKLNDELQGLVRYGDWRCKKDTQWTKRGVVKVVSKEEIGLQPTWCMSVDPPHWYEAECCVNHNSIYGMGLCGFIDKFGRELRKAADEVNMSVEKYAEKIDEEYYRMLPFVRPTCRGMQDLCKSKGFMRSIGGRIHHRPVRRGDYAITNYVCQGGASDILKAGLVAGWDAGVFEVLVPHLTVHDENIFSCPRTKEGVEAAREFSRCMSETTKLKVPIRVDEEAGPNWASCDNDKWREWNESVLGS